MKRKIKTALIVLVFLIVAAACTFLVNAESEYTVTYDFGGIRTTAAVDSLPEYAVGEYIPYKNGDYYASYIAMSVTRSGNNMTVVLDNTVAYYYKVSVGGTDTYYKSTDTFFSALNGTESNKPRTVTLLGDCFTKTSSSVSLSGNKKLYVDLNGFKLISAPEKVVTGGFTCFSVSTNSELYVYSSRPGGEIFQAGYTNIATDTIRNYTLFTLSGNGKLFIGDVTKPDGTVADGDNISVYTGMFALIQGYSTGSTPSLSMKGGNYYRTLRGYMNAFFSVRDSANDPVGSELRIEVDGANIYLHDGTFYSNYNSATFEIHKTHKTTVKNSLIAGSSKASLFTKIFDHAELSCSNTYLLLNTVGDPHLHLGNGCRTVSNVGNGSLAKNFEKKTVEYNDNTFAFTGADGKVLTGVGVKDSVAKIAPGSFDVSHKSDEYILKYVIADHTVSSEITWVSPLGESVTEAWLNGALPVPGMSLPESETFTYTFDGISPVSEDKTYTARIIPNFKISTSLTLAVDMKYNVYIPASVDYIKSIKISDSDGNFLTLPEAVTVTKDEREYMRYTFDIPAPRAANAYFLHLELPYEKTGSETAVYTTEISVPLYADKLLEGDHSADSDALVYKVLAYIKAACEYFSAIDSADYYDNICARPELTHPTAYKGVEKGAPSSVPALDAFLDSVSVNFSAHLSFRYYIEDGYDLSEKHVFVSYFIGGDKRSYRITEESISLDKDNGKYYFEVALPAADLRVPMSIEIGSASYQYSLDNYIYSVNNTVAFDTEAQRAVAQDLVWALYDYSVAAGKVIGEQTPPLTLTLNGTPITEYNLVASEPSELAAAAEFNKALYDEYGIELNICSSTTGKSVEMRKTDPYSALDSCIYLDGDDIIIECAFNTFFVNLCRSFVNEYFIFSDGSVSLGPDFFTSYTYGKILYSEFDGVGTDDDFDAIVKAHEIANLKGYPVYAEPGASYYIKSTGARKAVIKTDTYWQGASFIIDDSDINLNSKTNSKTYNSVDLAEDKLEAAAAIFSVENDHAATSLPKDKISGLRIDKETVKKIDTGLGYPAMLVFYNSANYQYIRFGGNANSGAAQHELIVVDKDGNIDEKTPFLFDYDNVSSVNVFRCDTRPITVDGGGAVFTTLAPTTDICQDINGNTMYNSSYIGGRGISITRSNVTLKNVIHKVENEILPFKTIKGGSRTGGHCYSGFYSASSCTNVEYNSCIAQGRKMCSEGTYDISLNQANDVRYVNVRQSNFSEEGSTLDSEGIGLPNMSNCWGIMGANYIKNITYDNCVLTRFDAHAGCYNGTIKNSIVSTVSIIGGGDMLIEDSRIISRYSNYGGAITLRSDYGSTWNGTITIRNTTFDNYASSSSTYYNLISATWSCHDFGYTTYLPKVIVDNVTLSSKYSRVTRINIFSLSNGTAVSSLPIPSVSDTEKVTAYLATYGITFDPSWTDADVDARFAGINSVKEFSSPTLSLSSGTTVINVNPYVIPEYVVFVNNSSGITYRVAPDAYSALFADTDILSSLADIPESPEPPELPDTPITPPPTPLPGGNTGEETPFAPIP